MAALRVVGWWMVGWWIGDGEWRWRMGLMLGLKAGRVAGLGWGAAGVGCLVGRGLVAWVEVGFGGVDRGDFRQPNVQIC